MKSRESNLSPDPLHAKLQALPEQAAPPALLALVIAEAKLHTKLRALPEQPAPRSIVSAVLATLATGNSLPWWRQPWLVWPRALQFISASVSVLVLAGAVWGVSGLQPSLTSATEFTPQFSALETTQAIFQAFSHAALLLLGSMPLLHAALGLAMLLALYLVCVGLGTLCYRVALNKI